MIYDAYLFVVGCCCCCWIVTLVNIDVIFQPDCRMVQSHSAMSKPILPVPFDVPATDCATDVVQYRANYHVISMTSIVFLPPCNSEGGILR